MRRTYIVIVAVVVVAIGGLMYLGTGQQPAVDVGGVDWGGDVNSEETDSEGEVGSYGAVDRETTEPAYDQRTATGPAFAFDVAEIERCGTTCREVTATVTNSGNETATDVQASTSLYAGENSTDSEALVWEGTETIGTLDAGESYTTTERIELSFGDAATIQANDGWITIQTTVESAERTTTFQRTRQVI
jgi:hypothetical protein